MSELELAIELISDQYSYLSSDCKSDLMHLCEIVTVEKSTIIFKEGQYADKMYFIIQGSARAFYLKEGKEITDWFAFEGDFVTSVDGFFKGIPCMYTIEVLEPTKYLQITRDSIFTLSDKHHSFERLGRIAVTKTMLQLQERVVSIQFESALQKYKALLISRPDITDRVPLAHIASYLGITQETLSRIRNPRNRI